ncbi:MAG: response regulator [Myxococcales bacterium]|nr:MAG: response regulator [Myxococcales bacterium]
MNFRALSSRLFSTCRSRSTSPTKRSVPVGARQSRVTFEVTDTGIGIAREKLDRIFAPFEQADGSSTRRHGGTGLGLAICSELVKLMGGTLRVDSVVGQGSRFSVSLLGEVRGASWVPPPPAPSSPVAEPLRPLRVLLVEDNPVNQIVASKMLERGGHRVWLASDGRAALDHLARDVFDLVLMDVQMPEMDGLEATRQLRELERATGRRTPVIALTARAAAADRAEALAAGVDAYLVKPFRAAELQGAMRQALEACAPPASGPG